MNRRQWQCMLFVLYIITMLLVMMISASKNIDRLIEIERDRDAIAQCAMKNI